jgi:hypothetical protein
MKSLIKISILFISVIVCSCGSDNAENKLKLNENATYKDFVDNSLLGNEAIASFYEEMSSALDDVLETVYGILTQGEIAEYKFTATETEDIKSTFGNLFSSGMDIVDMASSGIGIEMAYNTVVEQLRILQGFEKTFKKEKSAALNSGFKTYVTNVYPLKYKFTKDEEYLSLNLDKQTIKIFKSNPKLDTYFIDKLAPAYYDLVKSYMQLHKVVALNKLQKNQVDSLKLQMTSKDKNYGIFKNTKSIANFKDNYSEFNELNDFKTSEIAKEIEFMNEKSAKKLEKYSLKLNSNIEKMITYIGSDDLGSFEKIMLSNLKNVNKPEIKKILRKL